MIIKLLRLSTAEASLAQRLWQDPLLPGAGGRGGSWGPRELPGPEAFVVETPPGAMFSLGGETESQVCRTKQLSGPGCVF